MRARLLGSGLGTLALLALALGSGAASPGDLVAELAAFRVTVNEAGAEVLEPAERIWPGDLVEYRADYRNQGDGDLAGVQPLLPVPAGLEYVAGTAEPDRLQASTDGRRFEPVPLQRLVRQPDGSEKRVPVPLHEYRFLKWDVGTLDAGESARVRARMRVLPVPPSVSASAIDEAR